VFITSEIGDNMTEIQSKINIMLIEEHEKRNAELSELKQVMGKDDYERRVYREVYRYEHALNAVRQYNLSADDWEIEQTGKNRWEN